MAFTYKCIFAVADVVCYFQMSMYFCEFVTNALTVAQHDCSGSVTEPAPWHRALPRALVIVMCRQRSITNDRIDQLKKLASPPRFWEQETFLSKNDFLIAACTRTKVQLDDPSSKSIAVEFLRDFFFKIKWKRVLLNKQIWEKECHKLEKLESGCKHATRRTTCVPFQSVDNRGHRSWNWFVVRCRSHKVCSDPRERSTDGSSYLLPSRSGTATSWEPEAAIHFRGDRAAWKPVQATAARFYRQTVEKASRHASLGEWKKHRCSADGRVHAVGGESGIVKCKLPCSQTINAELQTVLRGGDENTSCFCHVTRASSSTTLIKCDSGRHCGVLPPLLPPVFPHVFDPTSSLTQFSLDLF